MVRNAGCMDWTDAAIERLKQLWVEGLSGNEVATQMGGGLSRCAILGKIHRLGLSRQHRQPRKAAPRRRKKAKAPKVPQPVSVNGESRESPPNKRPLDLLELQYGQCRYPEGDRVPYRFCGAPVMDGFPYCREHAARCYNKLLVTAA